MIVSTLIVILLVLVAVGIIWVVARNVIQTGTDQIDLSSKCLDVSVRATAAICSDWSSSILTQNCTVTLERTATGDALPGMMLAFTNGSENYVHDYSTSINALQTKTTGLISTTIANITEIEVTPYFLDDSNNTQLCSSKSTFNL